MSKIIHNKVSKFLKANPPKTMRLRCELCERKPLITIAHQDRYGLPLRFQLCPFCGMVTLNPRWTEDISARFYTKYYRPLVSEYNKNFNVDSASNDASIAKKRVSKLISAFHINSLIPSNPRILEIGGGEGNAAEVLRKKLSADVVILEPNSSEAKIAAEKGFTVINSILETVNLEPETFDFVLMLRTADHLVDCAKSFHKIYELLKPEGKVLLDGIDYFKKMSTFSSAITPLKIDHCYYFSPLTLAAMLNKHKLQPLVIDLNISDHIVILAERGKSGLGTNELKEQLFRTGANRFKEWEQIERRPRITKLVWSELSWMLSRLKRRIRGKQRV